MAIIKCKMCGGELTFTEGATVAECDYCGSKQTIPDQDNEKKLTLFARADRLRRACEFDKAASVYESIVAEFPEEAEAYWGLVLCRYGIEYVDDPATGKKVPTCHRSSFDSILEDVDFDQACENADAIARRLYREEAKAIEDIRKGILEVSGKEAPYDIFICYKETDENGSRTIDSVIAQDVYDALTGKGYRVFFSRISLEDKLGTEYEPYIFAALNSAKVMLAFGTDYEYYNAVWVKNEWSRFLALIAAGQKKTLIPCYKDIDAYDMPKEFQRLQAQDMGKVGAVQDLLRGIDKIMGSGGAERPHEAVTVQRTSGGATMEALLKRGYMALEDGACDNAEGFFNRVLDIDPESAWAYLGMAMAQAGCLTEEEFQERYTSTAWKADKNTARAKQYATSELQKKFEQWDAEKAEKAAVVEKEAAEIAAKEAARRAEMKPIYAQYRKRSALAAKRICIGEATNGIYCKSEPYFVGLTTDGRVAAAVAHGCNRNGECNVGGWTDIIAIDIVNAVCTIGLKSDGTVVVAGSGDNCKAASWANIVEISAGYHHTVGLKSDGTVVAVGRNQEGQCNVGDWTDIVAIAAGACHTIGLKSDGMVIATGDNSWGQCNVNDWTDIVAIAADARHTVGLKSDGTVVAAGDNQYGQCNVSKWTDIVNIIAKGYYTVGLKADGTVIAVGGNEEDWCNVGNWTDIVDIAVSYHHIVGLKSDGTVVAAGANDHYQCAVGGWSDIVALVSSDSCTVGLKSDGTVVNTYRYDWASNWKLFDSADTIEQEIAKTKERGQPEVVAKKAAERAARGAKMKPVYAEHRKRIALAANRICTTGGLVNLFGVKTDGRVIAAEDSWKDRDGRLRMKDIVSITAYDESVVGIKADGTVVAAEDYVNRYVVNDWTDIVAIAVGGSNSIFGLKADGTVIAHGNPEYGKCNVSGWTNIVSIAAGSWHTVGLKADGTVVAVGNNDHGQCDVNDWTDIVAVVACGFNTIGLKADGMVVTVGRIDDNQCGVSDWTDIVAIAARDGHIIGLKLDGTVVAVGRNRQGECNVGDWTNIVAVAAGSYITIGLKSDGTVVKTHTDLQSGRSDEWAKDWKLFNSVDTIEQEVVQIRERFQEEKLRTTRRSALEDEKSAYQEQLKYLNGLFDGRRRRNVEARLAQIEAELRNL